jgi:hypothetical protein
MRHRIFQAASLVSAVLGGCTLVLWLATFLVSPWDHRISLSRSFHVAVWSGLTGDTLGRLVIFNNAQYGPYSGSTIQIADDKGNASPRLDREIEWGDTCGVYYRYFRWPAGQTLWTLAVSLWYPLWAFCILPAAWLLRHRSVALRA